MFVRLKCLHFVKKRFFSWINTQNYYFFVLILYISILYYCTEQRSVIILILCAEIQVILSYLILSYLILYILEKKFISSRHNYRVWLSRHNSQLTTLNSLTSLVMWDGGWVVCRCENKKNYWIADNYNDTVQVCKRFSHVSCSTPQSFYFHFHFLVHSTLSGTTRQVSMAAARTSRTRTHVRATSLFV